MRCSNTTRLRGKTSSCSPAARWSIGLVLHLLLAMLMVLPAVATSDVLEGGTLMFLHVWKCGGTSLRRLLCDWARSEDLPCATVASCRHLSLNVGHSKSNRELQEEQEHIQLYGCYSTNALARMIALIASPFKSSI